MKILLLSTVEHQSGSALRFRGLAAALARRGHDVHYLEPVPPGSDPETPAGVRRHPCPRLPGSPIVQGPLWLLHGVLAVLRVRPDVAWSLKALPNGWVPTALARLLGARAAVDLDDLDHAYYPAGPVRSVLHWFFRDAAARADDVTVHTTSMRERVAALRGAERRGGPGGEPSGEPRATGDDPSIVFVDQGIDVARFAPVAAAAASAGGLAGEAARLRRSLALANGPVILYAGHLGPASDLGPLLPALAPLARALPDARLLVVGDGVERGRLEARAREALPAGWVTFAGMVPHFRVPAYYALADVALNFLEDREANRYRASIKIREALAAGVPVVASRTPDGERFAEFVRIPDAPGAEAFVHALGEELASPDRVRAARGREWLERHGTFDAAIGAIAARWEAVES